MAEDTLLLLGGYGTTGRLIARLLLQETGCRVLLAGRNDVRARIAAEKLCAEFGAGRASGLATDAADPAALRRAMTGCRMVIVASSTSEYTGLIAHAALESSCDYFDLQYSAGKLAVLQGMADEILSAGRCFITDGGFHPGLVAILVHALAPRFDRLERAVVGSVIQIDWRGLDLVRATMREFVGELLGFQPLEWRDGAWRPGSFWSLWLPKTMDFGPPWGRRYGVPMFLEELRALPERYAGLKEVGFYVGGFNWFTDWIVMPVAMIALKLWPARALDPVGRFLYWSLRRFSRPPYVTLLRAEASGTRAGQPARAELVLSHPDGYVFTAAPVVACLLQYLDAAAPRPGLWLQAHYVEPARMLRDLARLGIETRERAG